MARHWFTLAAVLTVVIFSSGAHAQTVGLTLITTRASIDDDATLLEPGSVAIGVNGSFSSAPGAHYVSLPGLDFTLGLNQRLEFSSSGGFALSKDGENHTYGIDDNYLGLKILLVPNKGEHRPAIAIKPSLEILNNSSIDAAINSHRVSVVLPLLIEKDFDDFSLSYTGGYITRGLVFSTVKVEGDWWEHLNPVLSVSYTQFTSDLDALSAAGLNRRQIDLSVGLAREMSSHWSVSGEIGRTISRIDSASTTFECFVGVTFTTSLWSPGKTPRRFPIHF